MSILGKDEKVPEDIRKGSPREGNAIRFNQNLRVRWLGDNELSVTGGYDDSLDRLKTVNGVTVKYEKAN